jgi:hypothetical protein
MPKHQGELDGLCGPYAIANALEQCGLGDCSAEDVFQCACQALSQRRWPGVLWKGATFADLQRMLARCQRLLPGLAEVAITYPFMKSPPSSNDVYWKRFDALFEDERASRRCAIIGITRPTNHWIVATKDGSRVKLTDCAHGAPDRRKNRATLYAGSRCPDPNRWLIDRRELVLIEAQG